MSETPNDGAAPEEILAGEVLTDRVEQVDLQTEMQRSYLDYAMAVIIGRALPDVRDGLKPVHRRVLYAMFDGGYRPERSFNKCARVVGEVMGQYHPHGDGAIYDALVRLIQDWTMRYPLALGQGNFGSPGNDGAAAPRYTETKMAPLAMEMVRDIDEETVDFQDNYDGKNQEPTILPSRFPNLLVNGSSGIAVGMATNIPPHNLREVADGVQWYLQHPEASKEELLEALIVRIKGPDFPTGAQILGHRGIEDAYRTGRGSITMRAVVNVEEIQGRTCLVVTELPYQANPDNLAIKIADLVKDGKISGIADLRDETSGRTGQRLVIVLKRDAVAKVVLNNLYKHTQLQDNFSANMLAIVDNVPRTLSLDAFIRHWVTHQLEVIVRRTRYRLRKAEEAAHILRGYLKALDALDEVIALIRASQTVEDARGGLMTLLSIDEVQAAAILNMQLRRLAALERQKIQDEHDKLEREITEYQRILASPEVQRSIVSTELQDIVDRHGDERRTEILMGYDGDMSMEDLIPEEEMVVTITRGGYVKRTRSDNYRQQARGGKGIRGAQLRGDDVVEHFFVTTTHHWLLFFTDQGRVYRAKAHELPEANRNARGQHVANILAFQPDEKIAQVIALRDYTVAPYLVLATRKGLVKKTALTEYDNGRASGLIAINLREDDSLIGAALLTPDDDLLLVSRQAQSIRFSASDDALRPMGRPTSGVIGMRLGDDDELLAMQVAPAGGDEETTALLVVSDGGFGKRTALKEYRRQGRAGFGVLTAKMPEGRGQLVGALIVRDADEIFAITSTGVVIRMSVQPLRYLSRPTGGVKLVSLAAGSTVVAVAHNGEAAVEETLEAPDGAMLQGEAAPDGVGTPAPEADGTAPDGSTDQLPRPDASPEDEEGPA